jgi:alanine-synthesizing transaminase
MEVTQSAKLANVCYDIRGPVLQEAKRMEAEGHHVLKLNIGNPAPFGFEAPEEMLQDIILNLPSAHGYGDSKGLLSARRAVVQHYQEKAVAGVDIEDVWLGNGVSELITLSLQALLNNGDEVLVPMPDYPLWTAAITLCGGTAVHYLCDESADWQPDLDDIAAKITARTKAIVVINPNNPTGAVYARDTLLQIVELARRHNLILFSDEIYEKILYDDETHTCTAALAPDLLCLTFNGLSKAYRVAGFRTGWMILSGPKHHATSYIEGLEILANMRLCPNVPTQYAVQTALGGYQSINDLVLPGGRLADQRDTGVATAERDPRRLVCQTQRRAVRLPTPRTGRVPDPRRRAFCPRPPACAADPCRARHRLQLAPTGPLPGRDVTQGRRPRGGHRPHRHIPRHRTARTDEAPSEEAHVSNDPTHRRLPPRGRPSLLVASTATMRRRFGSRPNPSGSAAAGTTQPTVVACRSRCPTRIEMSLPMSDQPRRGSPARGPW